jgi:hypothetical protein
MSSAETYGVKVEVCLNPVIDACDHPRTPQSMSILGRSHVSGIQFVTAGNGKASAESGPKVTGSSPSSSQFQ